MDSECGGQVGPGWRLWAPRALTPQPERSQPPFPAPSAAGATGTAERFLRERAPPSLASQQHLRAPAPRPSVCLHQLHSLQLTPEMSVWPET